MEIVTHYNILLKYIITVIITINNENIFHGS